MTRTDQPLSRHESTIKKTRSGWKPRRVKLCANILVWTGIFMSIVVAGLIDLVITSISSVGPFATLPIWIGGLFVGTAFVTAGILLAASTMRGGSFQTPEKWYGLPRSVVLAIAPLEGQRRKLRSDRAEGQRILHALPGDSANRQHVQDEVDRMKNEMSALEVQIESIIDEHALESETSQKIRAEDARTRKEIDAEERADDWLG